MDRRCLTVAIIGEPNVGKSTLINQMVGEKVSIVTPKVQTTRDVIRGIINKDNTQLIFIDTPGIFKAKYPLEKLILKNAKRGLAECDVVLLLVDSKKGITEGIRHIISYIKEKKCIIAINKVDLVKKEFLLALIDKLNKLHGFKDIFMVSALKNDGVISLIEHILKLAHPAEWLYDEDYYTDMPVRRMAEEITRGQLFMQLNKELPYSLKVETTLWEEQKDGSLKLYQTIMLTRMSHKNIVIGEDGSKIKSIGTKARVELEKLLGRRVHLFLHAKVQEDWITKEGLDFST